MRPAMPASRVRRSGMPQPVKLSDAFVDAALDAAADADRSMPARTSIGPAYASTSTGACAAQAPGNFSSTRPRNSS